MLNYTGTIVTRCRTTGHTDAFSFSGYTSFKDVVRMVKERARSYEVRNLIGVCIEDCKLVDTFQFNADECLELVTSC